MADETPADAKAAKRLHDYWVRQVATQRRKRDAAEREATAEREHLYEAMLSAQEAGGVTWDELAELSGLVRSRVGQVLERQRKRRTAAQAKKTTDQEALT